jgi:hypothetical protein
MTATQPTTTISLPYLVGDPVRVQRTGVTYSGRISSIHRRDNGVEYVIRTHATDGGMGQVLNIWTTSGQPSFLTPPQVGGEQR